MRFLPEHVDAFARWSCDSNPTYVDPSFARSTFFGRPIVPGVLTVLDTLRETLPPDVREIASLEVEFRGAVLIGEEYAVTSTRDDAGFVATVSHGGQTVLTVRADVRNPAAAGTADSWWTGQLSEPRTVPAIPSIDDLQQGVEVRGRFPARE